MSENTAVETAAVEGQLELGGMPEPTPQKAAELDVLALLGDREEFTAYQIHSVLNEIFKVAEVAPVRPQMIYNYARNGLLVRGESVAKGTYAARKYTRDEVLGFVARFAPKYIKNHS